MSASKFVRISAFGVIPSALGLRTEFYSGRGFALSSASGCGCVRVVAKGPNRTPREDLLYVTEEMKSRKRKLNDVLEGKKGGGKKRKRKLYENV